MKGLLSDDDELKATDGSPLDYFIFDGEAGEQVTITAESSDFDIMVGLFLVTEDDLVAVAANNDVDRTTTNARIETTLSTTGQYVIFVATADSAGRGDYVVTLDGTEDSYE